MAAVKDKCDADVEDKTLRRILGQSRYEIVTSAKILVVGAGGIGCELLKNLVLAGFKHIEVVDLDTIDVSNLNRQFLFRRQHVDRSKAEVAAEAAQSFCPSSSIIAHHGNVKDPKFGVEFVSKFDAVVSGLDNVEARRHVNRVCLAADKPLLEAGSTGHLGQVTVIKKGETECYECLPRATQKVYPVCTLRSTPDKPVHCLVWAKSLYNLCFGPRDEGNLLADLGEGMHGLQEAKEAGRADEVSRCIFQHVFVAEITKAAGMDQPWAHGRPKELHFDELVRAEAEGEDCKAGQKKEERGEKEEKELLDAQRVRTVGADLRGFVAAVTALLAPERKRQLGSESAFSKDDPAAMDFVHCAASLRMACYQIPRISRWESQSIAGAIVPAVASTNAIVAGVQVIQLMHVLTASKKNEKLLESSCRSVWIRYPAPSKNRIVQPSRLMKPKPTCFVCGTRTARLVVRSLDDWTMADFVKVCLEKGLGTHRAAVYHSGSCIFDPDYAVPSSDAAEEGLHPDWTLAAWKLSSGSILHVEDEGQGFSCHAVVLCDPALSEDEFPVGFQVQERPNLAAEEPDGQGPPAQESKKRSRQEIGDGVDQEAQEPAMPPSKKHHRPQEAEEEVCVEVEPMAVPD